MSLGSTVRAVVDYLATLPRHALRVSEQSPEMSPERKIKLQQVFADIFNLVRPFPDAMEALRTYFRRTPDLEVVE